MPARYLLPCECGETVTIEVSQAGQTVTCSCGRSLLAPTLRAIKKLQPAAESAPAAAAEKRASQWNPVAGTTFVGGALLAMIGLIAVGFAYFSLLLLQRNLPVRDENQVREWLGEIEASEPAQLMTIWHDAVDRGLSDVEGSPWQEYRTESRKYAIVTRIGGVAVVLGVLLAVGSVFLNRAFS